MHYRLRDRLAAGTLAAGSLLCAPLARADSSHVVRNASSTPIVVVMDNNREVHAIASGANATFVDANPFDQPTFKVFIDGNDDGKVDEASRPVGSEKVPLDCIPLAKCALEWDGKSLHIVK